MNRVVGVATVFVAPGTVGQRRVFSEPPAPNACGYCKGACTIQVTDSYFNMTVDMNCVDCGGSGERPGGGPQTMRTLS